MHNPLSNPILLFFILQNRDSKLETDIHSIYEVSNQDWKEQTNQGNKQSNQRTAIKGMDRNEMGKTVFARFQAKSSPLPLE
jgi:hypothetical protein